MIAPNVNRPITIPLGEEMAIDTLEPIEAGLLEDLGADHYYAHSKD